MSIENAADTSSDTGADIEATAAAFERFLSDPDEGQPTPRPSRAEQEADADEAEALEPETEGDASEDDDDGLDPDALDEEPEDEGADQDDDAAAKPVDLSAKVTVKIGDKTEEVSIEEAIKGYQRQSDYTRKATEVAEARKATETELQAVREERAQYAQLLTALAAQIDQEAANGQPNWEELKANDPAEYAVKKIEWQEKAAKRQAIHAEQVRLAETQQVEQLAAMQEAVKAERVKLHEAVPAWKDEKVWSRDRAAIREYGVKAGWTAEELDAATDHRAILALHKAMKYDRLVEKRAAAKPATHKGPAPKPLRPGTSNKPAPAQRARTDAMKRLSKTGSVSDAARVFETLI